MGTLSYNACRRHWSLTWGKTPEERLKPSTCSSCQPSHCLVSNRVWIYLSKLTVVLPYSVVMLVQVSFEQKHQLLNFQKFSSHLFFNSPGMGLSQPRCCPVFLLIQTLSIHSCIHCYGWIESHPCRTIGFCSKLIESMGLSMPCDVLPCARKLSYYSGLHHALHQEQGSPEHQFLFSISDQLPWFVSERWGRSTE
jgi:hypothetical protein